MSDTPRTSAARTDKTQWIMGGPLGILLIHGLGGSPAELLMLARELGQAGHTVCTLQIAGHGRGDAALARSTAADWRESVLAAHAILSRRCQQVIACGLSMGAVLALDLARLRPKRVAGLALLAPALRLDGWAMPRTARLAGVLPAALVPESITFAERHPYGIKDERIRAIVLAGMQSRSGTKAAGTEASGPDDAGSAFTTPLRALIEFRTLADLVTRHLAEVRHPTLIIHPREDDMAHLSNAHDIAAGVSGPVDLLVLEDSYHLITLDRQRRKVTDRVLAFAAGFASDRAPSTGSAEAMLEPRAIGRHHSINPASSSPVASIRSAARTTSLGTPLAETWRPRLRPADCAPAP